VKDERGGIAGAERGPSTPKAPSPRVGKHPLVQAIAFAGPIADNASEHSQDTPKQASDGPRSVGPGSPASSATLQQLFGRPEPEAATASAPAPRMSLEGLETELGEGTPLGGHQASLVQRVGADPAGTRLHTGSRAARVAARHGAVAVAAGNHVVMGSGAPAAGTPEGDALLLHEGAHVAQQEDAARDPVQRRQPIGAEVSAAEDDAGRAAGHAAFGGKPGNVTRTGVQLQRAPAHAMDPARYRAIEAKLKHLVAEKRGLVDGTGRGDMAAIDAEIDRLIRELRVDFGVQLDKGKILESAVGGKDMRVVDGRIVLSPSGSAHYLGERLGAQLQIDHVPPGETLQIGWRWRAAGGGALHRFLIAAPAFADKTTAREMALDTAFWALVPDAVDRAKGLEIVAELYVGKTDHATRTLSTGFIAMPERPIGSVQIVGAPERVVQNSRQELGIGPWTPDFRRYSIDWFVDDAPVAVDQLALRHTYPRLGKHTTRADIYRVRRNFGIRDKQLVTHATTSFEVMTDARYGDKFLTEVEGSPLRPKPVSVHDMLTSGDQSQAEIQHRIDQGGGQRDYWEDRQKAQKQRLAKLRELAPGHATDKPLPADPTQLEPGGSYSGPVTAALVMSSGGGAQPLTLHLTIHDVGGVWQARLIDSTSKKVVAANGTGATPLAAYTSVFEAWRTDNDYPTGGHVVHRFMPPGWALGASFATTTSWKQAKEWVDGILAVGGFLVGALLLAAPDLTITKLLGGVLVAAVVARSSVAIYERIRNGGDALSTENILDGVAIVTAFVGVSGGALRSIGIKAVNPTIYRAGNWTIMGAVAADAGTFIYASAEAVAALQVIQSNPTLDEGQKSGELLRIMASLFVTGAMLLASNRDLVRNGLSPHDFVQSKLEPGAKPELDIGARLDAEYELKQAGRWTKETSKLGDAALLGELFTNRSRQELQASLANKAGAKPAAALADALGNDAFVQLHRDLGEGTLAAFGKELGVAKLQDLHSELGTSDFGSLVKQLGVPHVTALTRSLSGPQIKSLVDGLGPATLKRTAAVLAPGELKNLALAGAHALKKLASLHGFHLKNLSHLRPAELGHLAKLDVARISKLSTLPPSEVAKAAPFTQAAVDVKLTDLGTTEKHVGAELAAPETAHHLRETNFADRGLKPNTGGKGIKLTVAGKGAPVSIEAPEFVRLEPIPAGASGKPTITRIEIEAPRSDATSEAVVKGDLIRGPTDWEVPIPGSPYPKVSVEVSPGGLIPYTKVEVPPPGTRVQIKPKNVANSGFAGGHTRDAWNTAEKTYGDFVTKTGETGIKFRVPTSPEVIEVAAIRAEVRVGAKTKQIPDPKTVFEKGNHLNAFEAHAKPYLAAKLEALRRATPRPADGTIITIDVPVRWTDGSDAVVKVEMPWNSHPHGDLEITTWWLAQSNFAKGSLFNP
jgi:hypothetical protein